MRSVFDVCSRSSSLTASRKDSPIAPMMVCIRGGNLAEMTAQGTFGVAGSTHEAGPQLARDKGVDARCS